MGALEAHQDRHGQEHRTGTSRAEQTTETMVELGALEAMAVQGAQEAMAELGAQEAMAVQGAQEAMAGGPRGRGLGPLGLAPTARTLSTPPKKNSLGKLGGIRSPPRPNKQEQDRTSLRGQTNRTRQDPPQEQEALLG